MEAATSTTNPVKGELPRDKASLIVEAMRSSVAARGIAGSTFDHVAREAGVSRGLLHYYFGTKERLLLEVVRRESEVRLQRIEEAIEAAADAEDVLAAPETPSCSRWRVTSHSRRTTSISSRSFVPK